MDMMKMQGTFIVGNLEGYLAEPWRTDETKVNHMIGVSRVQKNRYGQPESLTMNINVGPKSVASVRDWAQKHQGKQVMVQVVPTAKSSPKGPWVSMFYPQDGVLEVIG